MKKFLTLALGLALSLALLVSCSQESEKTIKVAATPAPHAEIFEVAKEILAEDGITLEIIEFTDYIQPNSATESGDVMVNYFQHVAYLESFNDDNDTHLVNVANIHYEPFGLYPGNVASVAELAEGAKIAVPNDPSNEARALLLLEAQGIIKLEEGVGLKATKLDIVETYPANIDIVEMEAAQLPSTLGSVDMAVINGNYAIQGGLSVADDAIAIEDGTSEAAALYANILVVKEGNEENELVQALIDAMKSEKVRDFINESYDGAVVPLF